MSHGYFNFRFYEADGRWEAREFWRRWRRLHRNETRWTAPEWSWLGSLISSRGREHPDGETARIVGSESTHFFRMEPRFFSAEALPQRRRTSSLSSDTSAGHLQMGPLFEVPVSAGIGLQDPRRPDGISYLAWIHIANSTDALERFIGLVSEQLQGSGTSSFLLPTSLASGLHGGILQNHFDRPAPQYAPFHPPYAAEIFASVCRPAGRSQIYIDTEIARNDDTGPARIRPLRVEDLVDNLLDLALQSAAEWGHFPTMDEIELRFLLARFLPWSPFGWVAEVDGKSVGYLLVQPDYGKALAQSEGGRGFLGWAKLAVFRRQNPDAGRLLLGGVLPSHRRQGIGRQLWAELRREAHRRSWTEVSAGPFPTGSHGENFCRGMGFQERQSYILYRYDVR